MDKISHKRLISVDVFRGIIMFLLLAEHVDLYYLLSFAIPEDLVFHKITYQFFHHEWNGMYFWDLIQPYFTFIIGIAMAFSINKRWARGDSWLATFKHIIFRCAILFIIGIVLQCCAKDQVVWDLWNILTLLSISIFITFLTLRLPNFTKFVISICILLITEMLYRNFSIDGFNRPLIKHQNFGTYIDLLLMGKTHPDGWVFFNSIPTTVHMIWGVMSGNLLLSLRSETQKLKILVMCGLAGVFIGYGMDSLQISLINKHVSTSAFVIASGGWCLLTFAFFYWLIDLKQYKVWSQFFIVIGQNPLFIYIFSRALGRKWLYPLVAMFTTSIIGRFNISEGLMNLTTYVVILSLEWHICYWLYKKKIFIKI